MLRRISEVLSVGLYLSTSMIPVVAMDNPRLADNTGIATVTPAEENDLSASRVSRKRKNRDHDEENVRASKRKRSTAPNDKSAERDQELEQRNYADRFKEYEIDATICNADVIENAKLAWQDFHLDPEKKKYRDALFYRLYAGIIPLSDIIDFDLSQVITRIHVSKKMSDLDLFAWCVLRATHYFYGEKGPLKKEITHSREALNKILQNKVDNDASKDSFYQLCWGLQHISPSEGTKAKKYIKAACKDQNGFSAFILSKITEKFGKNNMSSIITKYMIRASRFGYQHGNYLLGERYLYLGDNKRGQYYIEKGAKLKEEYSEGLFNNAGYKKFSIIYNKVKQNDSQAQLDMANILMGDQEKILGDFPLTLFTSVEDARKVLLKSEARGNAEAMYDLAMLVLEDSSDSGNSDRSQEVKEAWERVENAANLGHMKTISYLARIAYNSFDFEKALTLYKRYQAQTDQDSIDVLSIFYNQNFQEVMDIYERTLMDDPIAMNILGIFFLNKNQPSRSEECFLHALELGCKEAAYYLGEIYFQKQNQDIVRARQMYLVAADKVPEAFTKLAQIALMQGELEEAIKYCHHATQHDLSDVLQITTDPVYLKLVEMLSLDDSILININLGNIFINEQSRVEVLGDLKDSGVFTAIPYNVNKALQLWESVIQMLPSKDDTVNFSDFWEKYNIMIICNNLYLNYTSVQQVQNLHRAKELLELMEEMGDGGAAYILAMAHSMVPNNLGIAVLNPDLASTYLHKAAARNHLEVLRLLTIAYVSGNAKFNILADNFEALKYATLWFKHLPADQRNNPQNIMLYKKVLSKIFSNFNYNNVGEMTNEQRQTLDSFVTGETSDLVNLQNLQASYLFFLDQFKDNVMTNSFKSCPAIIELCLNIAEGSGDLQKLMTVFHENIDKPGFLVGGLGPRSKEIRDQIRKNPDCFPIEKTPFLFGYKDIIEDSQKLDGLFFNLKKFASWNNNVLNLLEQYGDKNVDTINLVLEVLSLNKDARGLYEYAKAIFETIFMNDHATWTQDKRLEWAKNMLKEMQEAYCSEEIITSLNESKENFYKIMRDTVPHRNKIFKEANSFLVN